VKLLLPVNQTLQFCLASAEFVALRWKQQIASVSATATKTRIVADSVQCVVGLTLSDTEPMAGVQ